MQTTLVVVRPFGTHAIGDRITSPETIAAALASDHRGCVVPVLTPATQAAEH